MNTVGQEENELQESTQEVEKDQHVEKKVKKKRDHPELRGNRIISKLSDVILFGGMVPNEARVTGCMHATIAQSYHPIHIEMLKVSSPFTSTENKKTGSLGRKYYIPYALYGSSYTYSPQRNASFKDFGSEGMTVELFTLFEEALLNASLYDRSAVKGFIEPLLVVKVIKSKKVKNRFDDLQSDISVMMKNTHLLNSDDVKLNVTELQRQLCTGLEVEEYDRIEVHASRSGKRKFKGVYELATTYAPFSVEPDDLEKAIEYVVVYEVKQSNPNGDPEMDNMPRRFADTNIGLISGERQKRWIRDYIESSGHLIFGSRKSTLEKSKDRFDAMCKVLESN